MKRIPYEERFWAKVDKSGSCWLWTACKHHAGYGIIRRNGANFTAHRESYRLTHGDIPEDQIIRHTCDTPLCVNPDHLLLGTPADNAQDMVDRGRQLRGERSPRARLTETQVRRIAQLRAEGGTATTISRDVGVSKSSVCHVIAGRVWSHVTGIGAS